MSNIQKLFSERIEIFSAVEFTKVSVLTGIVKISLKVFTMHLVFAAKYDAVLTTEPQFKFKVLGITVLQTSQTFVVKSICIMCLLFIAKQTLLECIRLRTFGRYGLQQVQVDTHYLQMYLWRFVQDEK